MHYYTILQGVDHYETLHKTKTYLSFFTGAIIILAAFEHDTAFPTSLTPVTGSVVSQDHIEDRPGREIPLPRMKQ